MKRIVVVFLLIALAAFSISFFMFNSTVLAECNEYGYDTVTGEPCTYTPPPTTPTTPTDRTAYEKCKEASDPDFLSFPRWHRGLECAPDGSIEIDGGEIGDIVFKIALNIVDIMLRLIGILAVGFIIWGGIQYILARGEPEKAKNGLNTIIRAAIGMVIAMIAATLGDLNCSEQE